MAQRLGRLIWARATAKTIEKTPAVAPAFSVFSRENQVGMRAVGMIPYWKWEAKKREVDAETKAEAERKCRERDDAIADGIEDAVAQQVIWSSLSSSPSHSGSSWGDNGGDDDAWDD